jgi:hypothetical protein
LQQALNYAIQNIQEIQIEHRIVLGDSSIRYLELNTTVMRDEGDGSTHLLSISVDITERKASTNYLFQVMSI